MGETSVIEINLGFLGAGNMAEALLRGFLETGTCSAPHVWAADVNPERLAYMARTLGVHTTTNNAELLAACPLVVLAVKPQQLPDLLKSLQSDFLPARHTVFSIAAGIPLPVLEKWLGQPLKLVRLMPNTPAKLRAGATAYCLGRLSGEPEKELVEQLFSAVGTVVQVEETAMNAVTALSGSGPAYVFRFCELLTQAGQALGLSAPVAEALSVQTVLGAARMLAETGEAAAVLRQAVTSRGGTTEAALAYLEEKHFPEIVQAALQRACDRAAELTPRETEK
jgi:pyrroline-5-carboxylate reductase